MKSLDQSKNKSSALKDRYLVEKAQVEKVPVDWFKAYLTQSEYDEEKARAMESHLKHVKALQAKVDVFLTDKVDALSYYEYEGLMN